MDDQRNNIIAGIRAGRPDEIPLPDVPMYPYDGNPVEDFITKLVGFDGRVIKFKNRDAAIAWLNSQPEMEPDKNIIYSSLKDVNGNFSEPELENLASAAKIQTCVTEGKLGVGEMGAIWVTDESLGKSVCALLAKKLFIFLDSALIEGGLLQTYAKLKLRDHQYGSFFTGPSATADIEAVRITGAQGPLALTALIYNCSEASEPPVLIVNQNADSSVWEKVEEEPD